VVVITYDNGGSSANYANSSNETVTISPSISGDVVSVEFLSFNTEENYDGLMIYDGPDTSSPLIDSGYEPSSSFYNAPVGSWNGTGDFSAEGETFTSSHPSGSLTFVFTSDTSINKAGWEAEVNCSVPLSLAFQEVFTDPRAALSSSVAFHDVDGDADEDVIITGSTQRNQNGPSGGQVSRLYKNNGMGNLSFDNSTPFMGLSYSSLSYHDLNNDGIMDVVSSGEDYTTGTNYVKYYSSDGTGNFSMMNGPSFPNMKRVDFKIADFNNDGVKDVLFIGLNANNANPSIRLFENTGSASSPNYFNQFAPPPIPAVRKGSIAVADVDGDGMNDIFISGQLADGTKISRLYKNDGNFQFSEIMGTAFDQVDSGDSAFADVDDDGDEDLLITGKDSNDNNVLKLYLNDGNAVFTEAVDAISVSSDFLMEAFDFGDVDGDGDFDVLLTGYNTSNYNRMTTIWENLLYSPGSAEKASINSPGMSIDLDESEVSFGNGFKLHPNPTDKAYFNIYTPDLEGKVSISIFDAYGRVILSEDLQIRNENVSINSEGLMSGIYMVKLTKGQHTFSSKLIVK